ncbi:5'/3'-nucleotidase SurE [Candidatus Neptunochlamydia vexilliferae]|uniref:5'/3'-nucleotidase SurE n=1 Tax=Candidatus Neptunichlamydia vexilliferae TaxID=1651774 RepID=UPI001890D768|nr:5'/3'-nucleotidase SurE [Candidatus Neptunochlamydia vexilliferae]
MKKLNIILTNDDGISSKGLYTLWEALKEIANLTIVAPMKQQSGKAMSVTYYGPLKVHQVETFGDSAAWKVEGTPADCVKVALGGLADSPPDLIVSGINHGANAGRSILYSGTAGCVIQGILQGIPGIAFSYTCEKTEEFPQVKPYIAPIVDYIVNHPLREGTFLNVNFPNKTIQGVKMARQGRAFWLEAPRKELHEEGHLEFYLEEIGHDHDEHPESDIALLKAGFATAVPIHINELTDQAHFDNYKDHFEQSIRA